MKVLLLPVLISIALCVSSCHAALRRRSAGTIARNSEQRHRELFTGQILRLELINAITDTKVVDLVNGAVIAVNTIPGMSTPNFNINATVTANVKSINFGHNANVSVRIENSALWAFCGNDGNNFYKCDALGYGNHTVTATPYNATKAGGTAGLAMTVSFQIVQTTPKAPTTKAPTTKAPTTKSPTTKSPTTKSPITKSPTTKSPTTKSPTTSAPVTSAPVPVPTLSPIATSNAPVSSAPVTPAPVPVATAAPVSVSAPTKAPTNSPVASTPIAPPSAPVVVPFSGITRLELIYTGVVPNVAVMNLTLGTVNVANLAALRLPPTATFNINAVRNDGTVNSVYFANNKQRESSLPWAYCGNVGPIYNNCGDLVSGRTVNVTIVPYPLSGQAGTPYPMIWSTITIIDGTVAPTITRRPTSAPVTRKPTSAPVIPPPTAPVTPPPPKPQKLLHSKGRPTSHFPVAEAQGALIGTDMVIVGGFLAGFNNVSTQTNVLDTTNSSATWQRMDDYPFPIGITHGAFVVVGTKFYICGGYAGGGIGMHTDVCMVYDHSQPKGVGKQWSLFTPLPGGGRAGGGMVYDSTLNALIFAAGATRPVAQSRSALDHNNTWIYSLSNPSAGWQPRAPMPFLANHMSFVTAYDAMGIERHYFTGGQKQEDEPNGNVADHYEYDAINDVWIKRKFMTIPRSHAASSTRPFGCGFIMVAGCTNGGKKIADTSYYDIPSDTWTSIGNLTVDINTPVCDISNGVLSCDTGWDSGRFSKKIAISL